MPDAPDVRTQGFIVVAGASAGGVSALRQLVRALPGDFPAPVLIVQHIGAHRSILPAILSQGSALPARHAIDGEPIVPGVIYVAPPDHHLLVDDHRLRLMRGPKEHFTRPAIDPLFRTAALQYGPGVVGLVLTGRLDDGTAGLQAVKRCGGVVVVQDPEEAEEPEMPSSALRHVRVDHCVRLAEMPALLDCLVRSPLPTAEVPAMNDADEAADPQVVRAEQALSEGGVDAAAVLAKIAKPSTMTCPDCHGVLWEINRSDPVRYRCHTGHAYSLRTLSSAQDEAVDSALWVAIRALQEKALVLERQAREAMLHPDDEPAAAERLLARADRLKTQALALRELAVSEH